MARRFRFNLEPVLRYREIMEDQRRREFAEANRRAEEERLRREELASERSGIQDDIVRLYAEKAPFQSVVASYHMVGWLEGEMIESMNRQRQLDQVREQRRQLLVTARQNTQIMETLKERRREEFNYEQDKAEQSILDELAIQARARRNLERKNSGEGE